MSAGRSDREEAARLLRCKCIPSWKFHANNCPVQPGEHQENWARQVDAQIEALQRAYDTLCEEQADTLRDLAVFHQDRIHAARRILDFFDGDEIPPHIHEKLVAALSDKEQVDALVASAPERKPLGRFIGLKVRPWRDP